MYTAIIFLHIKKIVLGKLKCGSCLKILAFILLEILFLCGFLLFCPLFPFLISAELYSLHENIFVPVVYLSSNSKSSHEHGIYLVVDNTEGP